MKYKSEVVFSYGDALVSAIYSFFLASVIVNRYGSEFYGEFVYIQTSAALLLLFGSFGMSGIFKRELASQEMSLKQATTLIFATRVVLLPLSLILIYFLSLDGYFLLSFLLLGTFYLLTSFQVSLGRSFKQLLLNFVMKISLISSVFALDNERLNYGFFLISLTGIVLLVFFYRLTTIGVSEVWKYINLGWPLLLASGAEFLLLKSDQLILGFYGMKNELATYAILVQFLTLIMILPLSAYKVMMTALRRDRSQLQVFEAKGKQYIIIYSGLSAVALIGILSLVIPYFFELSYRVDNAMIFLSLVLVVLMIWNRFYNYLNLTIENDGLIGNAFFLL